MVLSIKKRKTVKRTLKKIVKRKVVRFSAVKKHKNTKKGSLKKRSKKNHKFGLEQTRFCCKDIDNSVMEINKQLDKLVLLRKGLPETEDLKKFYNSIDGLRAQINSSSPSEDLLKISGTGDNQDISRFVGSIKAELNKPEPDFKLISENFAFAGKSLKGRDVDVSGIFKLTEALPNMSDKDYKKGVVQDLDKINLSNDKYESLVNVYSKIFSPI